MAPQELPAATPGQARREIVSRAQRAADEALAPSANEVDRDARFPREAMAALRKESLLGGLVPRDLGGLGFNVHELSEICTVLGQRCATSAMVYAMHQIQVACLVRHGSKESYFRRFMGEELVEKQALLASATTEAGVGGDVRTSLCAVELEGERFKLQKNAPVISYGVDADAILVTARRAPDAANSDQVIVLCRKPETTLEQTGSWDTLGFRGTDSRGFKLATTGAREQILPQPYAEISQQTMLPTSHIVWSSLWLGIATDAVHRARAFVREEARKRPGATSPASLRLAEVVVRLQEMSSLVKNCVREYADKYDDADALSSIGFALRMNNLKISAARMVVEIVSAALQITGIAGYRLDSKYTLGRHLRDAYGASLMVNNDRIYGANAQMLLVYKED